MKTIGVNQSGVITSLLVKDHPKWMWYREAIQNAIESTQSYVTAKKIEIPVDINVRTLDLVDLIQEIKDDNIIIPENKHFEIDSFIDGSMMTISDAPWPGLSPDLLSVILVMCTQAKGNVLIHQKMFESRLFFVDNLIDMGAQIILCDPHRATIMGLDRRVPLKGITMTSPDIRAGVSLLIAAMSAKGISTIHNIEQIDRGYQNIETRLNAIGAKITRIE